MLRLRMSDGLNLDWLAEHHGSHASLQVSAGLQPHVKSGLVEQDMRAALPGSGCKPFGTVRLADPDGFLMSNDIISDVFVALDNDDDTQNHN